MRALLRDLNAGPHRDRLCLTVIVTGLVVLCLPVLLQVMWLVAVVGTLFLIVPLDRAADTDMIERERL